MVIYEKYPTGCCHITGVGMARGAVGGMLHVL